MSRYAALDLSALPAPTAIEGLDFEAILAARLTELESRLAETETPEKVAETMALARSIVASPMRYLSEAGAARELYMVNRINEAVRSVFLASAQGADLDQIGAGRGVVRRIEDESDPDNVIYEGDDPFRARIQLVIEAWSPHGTEGSYVYWALDADDRVADVVVYGPNDALDPPRPPAEPLMVVLSSEGDGTADAALLDAVFTHCTEDRRRPVADKLEVASAQPVGYQIEAVLHVGASEMAASIQAGAEAAATEFINSRIRIGRTLYRSSLAAALNVAGVMDVELISPAADVAIGPLEAPHCTGVILSVQTLASGWRDV